MACGRCRHWDYDTAPDDGFEDYNICRKAIFFHDIIDKPVHKMIVDDKCGVEATLYTHKDHVCGEMTEK